MVLAEFGSEWWNGSGRVAPGRVWLRSQCVGIAICKLCRLHRPCKWLDSKTNLVPVRHF